MNKNFIRIEQDRLALFERLSKETNEVLNRKPIQGSWSALQVVYHLLSAEENILKYMKKKSQADIGSLKNKSISSYFRIFALNRALKSGNKFKAPATLEEIPDQLLLKELEQKYASTRLAFSIFMDQLTKEGKLNKEVFKHPRAGYFTISQTMKFIEVHFERHFEQIERAILTAKK
jgi:hypothetical protein